MTYRVIQIGNIYERLLPCASARADPALIGTPSAPAYCGRFRPQVFAFGTSGVRGRWQNDFTEKRARQGAGICDFMNNRNVPAFVARRSFLAAVVIGTIPDAIRMWLPSGRETCLANGFA